MSAPWILLIVTSHANLGDTGKQTGVWLEELAVPYYALVDAGASITITSPSGGRPPIDPRSSSTPEGASKRFLDDREAQAKIEATRRLDAIDEVYDGYFVAGGHGAMWDLANDPALAKLLSRADAAGKPIASVCHGVAALTSVKNADGVPIVKGRRVTSFSNDEERAAKLENVVPFMLETRLVELGAKHEHAPNWKAFAVRDGHIVTGQNPQSSEATVRELLAAVKARTNAVTVTVRLSAKEPAVLRAYLAKVLPVTRAAQGCRYCHTHAMSDSPGEIVLIQGWDSAADQQRYIAWRESRGDLKELVALLSQPPRVELFELVDA